MLCLFVKNYFSLLPVDVVYDPNSFFYYQPKEGTPGDRVSWFKNQVQGQNTLQTMVKLVRVSATGVQRKTNHFLWATNACRLYKCKIYFETVQDITVLMLSGLNL